MKPVVLIVLFSIVLGHPKSLTDSNAVVGLTLSAGGALGFAHIGVLKVLEREQIPVSYISSNSMGSIIGGLYAAGYSVAQIESIAVAQDWQDLLSPSFKHTTKYVPKSHQIRRYVFRWSHDWFVPSIPRELISLQKVEFLLMRLLSKIEYDTEYYFDNLRIPLRVIAVDIVSGRRVVIKRGRLDRVIRGSIALPAVFAPQTALDEGILVDGGVLQYFPVDPLLEFQPDIIIASLTIVQDTTVGTTIADVLSKVTSIVGFEDIARQKSLADVVIEPDLNQFNAQDYARVSDIIAAGEEAAQAKVPAIRDVLSGRVPVANPKTINERKTPYVRNVDFIGLEQTRKATVRKEIRISPGMPLNFEMLIDGLAKLYETGLFSHIDYDLLPVTADSVDVLIKVDEQSYGFYLMGLRYDNADNATIGLEVGQSNILGSGICLRAAIHLGDPNEYRLGITDTRMLAHPMGYQIDLFWNSIDRSFYDNGEWLEDYNVDTRGGIAELGCAWAQRSYVNTGVKAYQAIYRLPEATFSDTLPRREWVCGPYLNLEIDDSNDPYFPLRGGRFGFKVFYSLEAIGARNNALKLNIFADRLIPITRWLTLAAGFESGTSTGELAWAEHFHTGGSNFVGFANDEFTTAHRTRIHLGLEFPTYAILSEKSPIIVQILADAAIFEPPDVLLPSNNLEFEDMEVGLGAGIRANTPIGPFRFVFGIGNPHRKPLSDNIQYRIHFSLGRDFRYTK
ncbi:MAG: BamA/TamA family outer membrane protein [candidate division WOR-3 bacterium]|nr:MAG: BamA/TamA family outer membrane protein [candidate division WOR-3 bacterium]